VCRNTRTGKYTSKSARVGIKPPAPAVSVQCGRGVPRAPEIGP